MQIEQLVAKTQWTDRIRRPIREGTRVTVIVPTTAAPERALQLRRAIRSILDQDGKILRANRAMREAFEPVHGRLDSLDFRQLYCGQEENDVELPHAAVLAGSSAAHAELELPALAGCPLYGVFT